VTGGFGERKIQADDPKNLGRSGNLFLRCAVTLIIGILDRRLDMTTVDITFGRAFRVWWSYAWRSLVLSLLVVIPLQIFVVTRLAPHIRAAAVGHGLGRPQLREALEFMGVVWPIAIASIIILQTIAMRWMLRRARWADFKLTASSLDAHQD
jgi:hypothetical protein